MILSSFRKNSKIFHNLLSRSSSLTSSTCTGTAPTKTLLPLLSSPQLPDSPCLFLLRTSASTRAFSSTRQKNKNQNQSSDSTTKMESVRKEVLESLGLSADGVNDGVWDGDSWRAGGDIFDSVNPATQQVIGRVRFGTPEDYERCVQSMMLAKSEWVSTPAPKRGEIVRQIGMALREKQDALGKLLSMEMGKILPEGKGEVQEFIDMCDLACGMGRQIPGQVLPSEREQHVMLETWSPLGAVGIITAFNFPNAVAGWNSAVSLVCGNTQILKGAESASLMSVAVQKIFIDVLKENNMPLGVATLCQGYGRDIGEKMINDTRINLVSFTGSTQVGRHVQSVVGNRFGETILELGGNNAIVVMANSNQEMALRSVLFAAVGTCGQRCTSLRRLLVHSEVYDAFVEKLTAAYGRVKIGNPLTEGTLVGPLHTKAAVDKYVGLIETVKAQGGKVLCGGKVVQKEELPEEIKEGNYVHPTVVEIDFNQPIVKEENFVPVLYISKFETLDGAIETNNSVDQGLSSALFSNDMRDVFQWIGPNGSDTGIINVNTACSGAEIGGAFGGNKHTGGGRESGSDSWKQYMRRGTCTINFGNELPLAQGIDFS